MAKVKGLKKLNNAIKVALADFGINKFKMNGDWAYYPEENIITYSLLENKLEDIWFNEFVKKRFGYKVKNSFMITVLHEVGHKETLEDIYESDTVYEFCMREKKRIEKAMENAKDKKECKKLEFEYFSLPDEIIATEWAVNYAKEHEAELMTAWIAIKKALTEFYAKNIESEV